MARLHEDADRVATGRPARCRRPGSGPADTTYSGTQYDIPNRRIIGKTVPTLNNYFKTSTLRAPNAPQTCFANEQVIDQLAYLAGQDPYQFRLNNISTARSARRERRRRQTRAVAVARRARRRRARPRTGSRGWRTRSKQTGDVRKGRGIALGGFANSQAGDRGRDRGEHEDRQDRRQAHVRRRRSPASSVAPALVENQMSGALIMGVEPRAATRRSRSTRAASRASTGSRTRCSASRTTRRSRRWSCSGRDLQPTGSGEPPTAPVAAASAPPLAGLAPLLAEEPALRAVIGRQPTVAVPDAGPGRSSSRRWPASRPAGRSCSRCRPAPRPSASRTTCAQFLGADAVELFPAWETLPFERVSARASRRWAAACACIWRLRDRRRALPASSSRRCARSCSGSARTSRTSSRSSSRRATQLDPRRARRAARRRSATAASTRSSTAARSRCAARSSTCSRRPPTHPVRIDLWGDEVDRLTEFAVDRPALHRRPRPRSRSSRAASCCRPTRSGRGPRELVGDASRGAASSGSGSPRARPFDGMESWLPWLADRRAPAHRPAARRRAQVAARRAAPHARPRPATCSTRRPTSPRTLATTWGARRRRDASRACHCRSTGCSRTPAQPVWTIAARRPTAPTRRCVAATRLGPGRRRRRRPRPTGSRDAAGRAATASSSPPTATGSARRGCADVLAGDGPRLRVARRRPTCTEPGGTIVVAPLDRGCRRCPARKLAVVAEADLTGRRRAPPPAAAARARRRRLLRRPQARRLRRAPPARRRPLRRHGQARRSAASSATTCCSSTRAATSSTSRPTRSTRVRQYTGGETPDAAPLGGADLAEDQGPGAQPRCARSPRSSSCSTRSGVTRPGHAFAADTPWQHELEEAFPYEETPDQLQGDRRRQGRHGAAGPDGPPGVRRRRLRQDRGRDPRRVQGGAGRQAGRGPRARPRCSPASTARRSATASPATRSGSRCSQPLPHRQGAGHAGGRRRRDGRRSTCVIGTHRLLSDDIKFKDLGLLVVDEEQRFGVQHKETIKQLRDERRRAHAHRHADPAHARDEPHRHPRPLAAATRRRPTASRSSPTSASTTSGPSPRRSAASCSARARCSSCTTGCRTSSTSPADVRELVPEARDRRRPRPDGRGHARAGRARLLGGRVRRARVHDDHRERHRHADGEHARRRPRRPARPRPAPPAARPGRPRAASGRTRTCFHPPDRALTEEAYERLKTIGESTELGSGFKIAMRDLEIRGAGNLLGAAQSGHIAAVGFDLYCQMVTEAVGELKGEPVPRAGRDQARRARRRLPAARLRRRARTLRLEAYRRLAAVTTDGRGRRHPRRVGGPLRPAAARRPTRCSTSPACGPSACASASAAITVQRNTARIAGLDAARSRRRCGSAAWCPRRWPRTDELVVPVPVAPADVATDAGRAARRALPAPGRAEPQSAAAPALASAAP